MYGKKIKLARKEAGLTQEDIAEKTGFPQSNISYWEKAEYPPLDYIVAALKVLKPGMKLYEFFIERGEEPENYVPSWVTKRHINILTMVHDLDGIDAEELLSAVSSILRILLRKKD